MNQSCKTDDSQLLGTQGLGQLLWRFAAPCVLAMLVTSLYNVCDQIFIGHSPLGYLGNAATSIVFPLTMVAMAFSLCFGDGAAAYLSLSLGKGDTKDIHRSIGNSLLAVFVISLLILALCLSCTDPLLRLLGATDESLSLARAYFFIIVGGFPIFMLGSSLGQIIRADGAPKVAMAAMLTGAITNIILDPIFIFPWGLNLGIQGAAWATIIGQVATLAISVWYLRCSQSFHLQAKSFKTDVKVLMATFQLGISSLISQLAIVVISIVTNVVLARYGVESVYGVDIPIAVLGIVMKVFTIVLSIAIGISIGAQPIFGYNYGAGNYARVRRLYAIVIACMLVVGVIGTLIFELAPDLVISVFGGDQPEYLEFARQTFRIFLALVSATCLIRATAITFQAVGKTIPATVLSLARDIVIFIPLALILPRFWGINGLLWAAPIADGLGLILTVIMAVPLWRELEQKEKEK